MRTIGRVLVFVMVLLAPLDGLSRARPERRQPDAGVSACRAGDAAALRGVLHVASLAITVTLAIARALAGDVAPLLDLGRRLITMDTTSTTIAKEHLSQQAPS
jgi:hypothetical protein